MGTDLTLYTTSTLDMDDPIYLDVIIPLQARNYDAWAEIQNLAQPIEINHDITCSDHDIRDASSFYGTHTACGLACLLSRPQYPFTKNGFDKAVITMLYALEMDYPVYLRFN